MRSRLLAAGDLLATADRLLVLTMLEEQGSVTAARPNQQRQVDRSMADAHTSYAGGVASLAAGDFAEAIRDFRQAWEATQAALSAAAR